MFILRASPPCRRPPSCTARWFGDAVASRRSGLASIEHDAVLPQHAPQMEPKWASGGFLGAAWRGLGGLLETSRGPGGLRSEIGAHFGPDLTPKLEPKSRQHQCYNSSKNRTRLLSPISGPQTPISARFWADFRSNIGFPAACTEGM